MTIALRLPDASPAESRGVVSARLPDGREAAQRGQDFDGVLAQLGDGPVPAEAAASTGVSAKAGNPTTSSSSLAGALAQLGATSAATTASTGTSQGLSAASAAGSAPSGLTPAPQSPSTMTQASSLTPTPGGVIPAPPRQTADLTEAAQAFAQDVAVAAKPVSPPADTARRNADSTDMHSKDGAAGTALDPALLAMAMAASGALPASAAPAQTTGAPTVSASASASAILPTTRRRDDAPAPTPADGTTVDEDAATSAGIPLVAATSLVTHMETAPVRDPRLTAGASTPPGAQTKSVGTAPADATPVGAAGAPPSSEPGVPHAGAAAEATPASDAAKSALPHKGETEPPIFVMPSSLTPSQAVARAIAVAVPPATTTANVPDAPQAASLAPPRTMTLQLTPQSLGTVSVTMHLASGGLDLTVSASDASTGATIRRDKDALAAAVQDQGYDLRSLTVHSGDAAGSATSDPGASPRQDSGGSQAFAQTGDGSLGAGRGNAQAGGGRPGQDAREPLPSSKPGHDDAPRASAAGTLYI